jgi:spermidine synthase
VSAPEAGEEGRGAGALYLLALGFLSGFAVMALEITAVRLLAPFFGATVHVWTNIIGVILLALSAGYFLGGKLADLRPEPRLLCRLMVAGAALGAAVPFVGPPLCRWLLPGDLELGSAFGAFWGGSLVVATILFLPPAFLLAMTGPLLIRCLSRTRGVGVSAGVVYGVSTLGSLLGTFLPTLWLVPRLGTRRAILLAVVPLAVAALPGALRRARVAATAGALLGGGALLAWAGSLPIRSGPGVLAERESAYQYVRVREEGPARFLTLNEGVDSFHSVWIRGQALTEGRYYDYFNVLPLIGQGGPGPALVLGLAGGTVARQFLHFLPERVTAVDGVEIDPVVTELGVRFFDLDPARVRILTRDARAILRALPAGKYAVIVADVYATQVYVPPHLASREFFEEAGRALRPGGVLGINLGGFTPASAVVRAVTNTLAAAFGGEAWLTELPGTRNYLAFAFRAPAPAWPPSRPQGLPAELVPLWDTVVSHGTLRWRVAGGEPVFTDDHAPVEDLTDREWRALYRTLRREASSRAADGG